MNKKKIVIGISIGFVVIILLASIGGIILSKTIFNSGITHAQDQMFGDQHLKTSVALIELHKIRYGKYPTSLNDLKFIGEWDKIALQSVKYYVNGEGTAYCIEVQTGWVGKPELNMPDEFWRGTGYSEKLKP